MPRNATRVELVTGGKFPVPCRQLAALNYPLLDRLGPPTSHRIGLSRVGVMMSQPALLYAAVRRPAISPAPRQSKRKSRRPYSGIGVRGMELSIGGGLQGG